ncbi:nuclear transport factor 2 family protein [Streptomyces cinereoruber]|uniref:nuclear transport factor 2 family protein n=1 Tax=Streptomyces cinereoruber TaxID=67260 RepID=UPI003EBA54D4
MNTTAPNTTAPNTTAPNATALGTAATALGTAAAAEAVGLHVASLAPRGAAVAALGGDFGPLPPLHPEEEDVVRTAVADRRREFAVGRHSARIALGGLGFAPPVIRRGPGGAPVWPPGVVGSITHAGGVCAAAVAPAADVAGLGIDIEPAEPLPDEVLTLVCTPGERHQLPPGPTAPLFAKVVFSAKESVYKVLSPLTGRFWDFHDVELALDLPGGGFRLDRGPFPVHGRFRVADGFVITVARPERPRALTTGGTLPAVPPPVPVLLPAPVSPSVSAPVRAVPDPGPVPASARAAAGPAPEGTPPQMTVAQHLSADVEKVRSYYRLVDEGDVEGLLALFAPDAVYHRPGYEPLTGRAELGRFYREERVVARGRHTVTSVTAAGGAVAVQGGFRGELRDGGTVALRYADFFALSPEGLFTRRDTYFFAPLV